MNDLEQQRRAIAGIHRRKAQDFEKAKPRDLERVCLSYPHAGDHMAPNFHVSALNLLVYDAHHWGRIVFGGAHEAVSSGAQITKTRNLIVRDFLKLDGIDWLFMVDADMEFPPDTLERLLEAADPVERPIVGGLCFALMRGEAQEVVPTLYQFPSDGRMGFVRQLSYEDNTLTRVAGTGAACLLVHRTVLEKMEADERFKRPFLWFAETPLDDDYISEDLTFCLRANACGFPIYVHTGIKIGHMKSWTVDEHAFIAGLPQHVTTPTLVVIASKSRRDMLFRLLDQLRPQGVAVVYDNGYDPPLQGAIDARGMGLHEMWNAGLDYAEKSAIEVGATEWNVVILNDDVEVAPDFLARLNAALRSDPDNWIAYPDTELRHGPDGKPVELADGEVAEFSNPEMAGQTITGWAFMIRGEACLRFDEQFEWWYGDSDIEKRVRAAGKRAVCAGGCRANHLDPVRSTATDPERLAQARADEKRFAAKWDLDPATLFFGVNPDWPDQ